MIKVKINFLNLHKQHYVVPVTFFVSLNEIMDFDNNMYNANGYLGEGLEHAMIIQ